MKVVYLGLIMMFAVMLSSCSSTGGTTVEGEGDLHLQPQGDKLARTNVQLGVGYMKQGKYDFALSKFRKALNIDDNLPDAHYAIAVLYEKLEKPAHAERHFQRAIELNPQYSDAQNAYGVYLCRKKLYVEADEQFTRALKNPLYKTSWQAMLNAGLCLLQSEIPDRYTRAEEYFRKVLQNSPRNAPALLGMARVSVVQKNYLRGRAYLQRYLDIGAHTPETLWLGIQIESELGDKKALAKYSHLLRKDFPDSDEAAKLDRKIQ